MNINVIDIKKQFNIMEQPNIIAVQQEATNKMRQKYTEQVNSLQSSTVTSNVTPLEPTTAAPVSVAEEITPTVTNEVAGVNFQAAPAELNPNTPIEEPASMVQPLDINTPSSVNEPVSVPGVEPATINPAPIVAPEVSQTPSAHQTPIASSNVLSDAEFFKQLEELINKTDIRQQSIKDQMLSVMHEKFYLAKNLNYIEDRVLEMSDVVKATKDLVAASNSLTQGSPEVTVTPNVAPVTPVTPAAPVQNDINPSVTPINPTPVAPSNDGGVPYTLNPNT